MTDSRRAKLFGHSSIVAQQAHAALAESAAVIPGTASQLNRISNSLGRLSTSLDSAGSMGESLVNDISTFAAAATVVRERGPQIVQGLRDVRLDRAATDTFELVAGTLDHIDSPTRASEQNIERLLTTLERDARIDANMPREMTELRGAARSIVRPKRQHGIATFQL